MSPNCRGKMLKTCCQLSLAFFFDWFFKIIETLYSNSYRNYQENTEALISLKDILQQCYPGLKNEY